jgi:hypothetical protein
MGMNRWSSSALRSCGAMVFGVGVLLALSSAGVAAEAEAHLAWFTDANVPGAAKSPASADASVAAVVGTYGQGFAGTAAASMEWTTLQQRQGYISLWIRPKWNGDDGQSHRLLRIGDPARNGLALEKAASGMLRFIMASPEKVTVSRSDVSAWRAGQWHHIVLAWFYNGDHPVGLPLWIDHVAVDGPIAGGCRFLDPQTMADRRLWIGDPSAQADFDEVICRDRLDAEGSWGMMASVYRDYFRTAPYDGIKMDLQPQRVPADRRVVAGFEKQFGLQALREGRWEPITEFAARYGQWGYFDAKPFIDWASTDTSIATVDENGRVKGLKPGRCAIYARFRQHRVGYNLEVTSPDKPDLDLICVELHPRYRNDAVKDRPAAGESVTVRVRLGNFGPAPLPAGAEIRFELIPVRDSDSYRFDASLSPAQTFTATVDRDLASGEETAVEFKFPYPAKPQWMRVRLDPSEQIDEFCEANNESIERTDARPIQLAYRPAVLKSCLAEKKVNHVGSLSYYDWLRAEKLRMDVMLPAAVWPTTGPYGVEEAYRVDAITALEDCEWDDQPYNRDSVYYDGGFPVDEPVDFTTVDAAIIHEFGHTILSQPDLYGYGVKASNIFLTDGQGKPYAGSCLLPVIEGDELMPFSPGVSIPCGGAYPSLMDSCQQWLHSSQAGHIMHYKGYRQDRFWGTQGRLIPTRANWLLVTDRDDRPLAGAAVYVYHVAQAPVQDSGAKYFADRPKFVGQTDAEGRFTFPNETDGEWDDPATDAVDGAIPVWNPFGGAKTDTAFTPNVWTVEGLLLIKIVSGDREEIQFMDLMAFNDAFLSGNQVLGKYPIRTNLTPSSEPTPVVRKPIPDAIREVNKQPVAVAPAEMTVRCNEEFEIDGSKSYDPEGQPLQYRWGDQGQWLSRDRHQGPVMKLKAPDKPGTVEYKFWVLDGVRCSDAAIIKVNVQ